MRFGTVYRAYDAEGVLLYVGCTTQPLKYRLSGHARNSAWWPLHARIEHDTPLPVDVALRSETDQITLLHPRFNKNAGRIGTFKPRAPQAKRNPTGVVHVAFAGARAAHRRRGGKRAA